MSPYSNIRKLAPMTKKEGVSVKTTPFQNAMRQYHRFNRHTINLRGKNI